ncbi:class I SAM-dependent methyltransferase [bacterium]|nr:class I SAM-dependent methyltransferase [bacterium]
MSELGLEVDPRRFFHSDAYLRSTARRLEHLATLNLPVHGRSVLEVGAGIGDLSHFYIDRGCSITITEVRPGNLRFLRKRFPEQQVLALDLDQPEPLAVQKHQIVHCYGLLYHLAQPDAALDYLASACQEMLVLETCVSFGSGEALNFLSEDKFDPTQASSGTGCRPTRAAILTRLRQHFAYVYLPRTQPNHPEFPLDWSAPGKHQAAFARAIFVASRTPLNSDQLILCDSSLPDQQQRSS